jgi:D-alanyl-D-alanine carboxypeptidase
MNEKAKSLGLEQTTFADPSGLEDENESSLRDLLRLIQYIYNNRSFILELTADADLATLYDSGDFGELENFNEIEGIENFIGGKVGETLAAGQTSISLHEVEIKDSKRVIAVIILNSTDRPGDVTKLLEYVSERF